MNNLIQSISIILFIILLSHQIHSQEKATDANLVGHVECEGLHVPFINIILEGTTIGTITDASGHFQLTNLPIGTYTVKVSGIGYKSVSRTITTEAKKTQEMKFLIKEDVLNIESVVVSADRNQSNRAEAPVLIQSITPKLFTQTQSVNIAEGLCFTPGLRTECNCQNCGFTQLRMNGLDGPYSQILMNSRPVFSGLAGVYGLELIPANMVERIEVVRGGGSALFGGNAIAGTVNIITKDPVRNTYSIDGKMGIIGVGGLKGAAPALDNQLNLNASVVSDDLKSGAYIYAMLRNKDAYDENGDEFTESVLMDNTTFGFSAFHKPGAKNKFTIDGYRVNEFRRGGNKLDYLPHETDVTEQVKHIVTGANLAYDQFINGNFDKISAYTAIQAVDRDSYYGALKDPNAYGKTVDFTSVIGIQYIKNSNNLLFAPSTTVIGIENNNNSILDKKLGANGKKNTVLTDQMVNTIGTFVQNDWKSENFNLSFGLRLDNYLILDRSVHEDYKAEDIQKSVLAPRLSALYKISPHLRLRAGYAKGYRAPQVFNEDLHVELVNATRVEHYNDENLTQETSHTFTASINSDFNVQKMNFDVLFEGFYTKLNNPFADEFFQIDESGRFGYLRTNAEDGAVVSGVNIEINSHLFKTFDLQVGATVQKSMFETQQAFISGEGNESKHFMRSPDTYGYATFTWKATKKFTTTLSLNYTGAMFVPHFGGEITPESVFSEFDEKIANLGKSILEAETLAEINELKLNKAGIIAQYEEMELMNAAIENNDIIEGERIEKTEEFFIVDLLISYDFYLTNETKLQVYAGVKNVFNQTQRQHDRGMFRDAGYIYGPCQPRTINIGLRLGNFLN